MKVEVLYIEDSPSDIELFKIATESGTKQINLNITDHLSDIESHLIRGVDVVISDFNLNGFDGLDVLSVVKEVSPEVPFIFFSSTIGEEKAVDLIRRGATDFILKDNIGKIPLAIDRAMKEMKLQGEIKQFESELIQKNELLDTLFNSLTDLVMLKSTDGRISKVNNAFCQFFKTTEANVIGKREENFMKSAEFKIADNYVLTRNQSYTYEGSYFNEVRKTKILEIIKSPLSSLTEVKGIVSVIRDVTEKKALEEQNAKDQFILQQAENQSNCGSFEFDKENDILSVSANFIKLLNLNPNNNYISQSRLIKFVHPQDQPTFIKRFEQSIELSLDFEMEHRYIPVGFTKGVKYCKTIVKPNPNSDGTIFYGTIVETTESRETSLALLNIQENERNKISKELHDNVGPKLSALSMFLNAEVRDEVKVQRLLNDSINDIRGLSRLLTTSILENQSFSTALKFLIENTPNEEIIELNTNFKDESISDFVGGQLYRIMQEAFNNIMKYACPSKINLEIIENAYFLNVSIVDNGKGFSMDNAKLGNGIRNMKERVRNCNGEFRIESTINKGTAIHIQIPNQNV